MGVLSQLKFAAPKSSSGEPGTGSANLLSLHASSPNIIRSRAGKQLFAGVSEWSLGGTSCVGSDATLHDAILLSDGVVVGCATAPGAVVVIAAILSNIAARPTDDQTFFVFVAVAAAVGVVVFFDMIITVTQNLPFEISKADGVIYRRGSCLR
jgi:hypothetical protein